MLEVSVMEKFFLKDSAEEAGQWGLYMQAVYSKGDERSTGMHIFESSSNGRHNIATTSSSFDDLCITCSSYDAGRPSRPIARPFLTQFSAQGGPKVGLGGMKDEWRWWDRFERTDMASFSIAIQRSYPGDVKIWTSKLCGQTEQG